MESHPATHCLFSLIFWNLAANVHNVVTPAFCISLEPVPCGCCCQFLLQSLRQLSVHSPQLQHPWCGRTLSWSCLCLGTMCFSLLSDEWFSVLCPRAFSGWHLVPRVSFLSSQCKCKVQGFFLISLIFSNQSHFVCIPHTCPVLNSDCVPAPFSPCFSLFIFPYKTWLRVASSNHSTDCILP